MQQLIKTLSLSFTIGSMLLGNSAEAVGQESRPLVESSSNYSPDQKTITSDQKSNQDLGVTTYEKGDQLVIEAALPGMTDSDVDMHLASGVLDISGKRKVDDQDELGRLYFYRSSNEFHYRIVLPDNIDSSKPEASLKNGMMTVTFPITKMVQRKKIPFKS